MSFLVSKKAQEEWKGPADGELQMRLSDRE